MHFKIVNRTKLLSTVKTMTFRGQDIKEVKDFGFGSILQCFESVNHRFSRYAIIYDKTEPQAVVSINRCGELTFFTSNSITSKIAYIKCLKDILTWYLSNYEKSMFVRVAKWYTEANRIVKMIGFKIYENHTYDIIYYIEDE